MNLACNLALRSTCSNPNRNVGCIVVDEKNERVLAHGYNGVASGENHICEYEKKTLKKNSGDIYTCNCVHAEANCLVKLNKFDWCKKIMYVTLSPCIMCARLIINAGINEVCIKEYYTDISPIKLLKESGILVRKYEK